MELLRALVLSALAVGWLTVGVSVESRRGAPRQGESPGPQVPTFRSAATTVEVDVIVKDAAGKFVADLGQGDFQLIEDGAAREIDTFYLVKAGAASESRPRAPGQEPVAVANASRAAVQRVFIFHFDTEHMAAGGLTRAQRAVGEFLSSEFRPGDVGGIVAGGSMLNKRVTSEREELRVAVAGIKPSPDVRSRQLDLREWPRIESLYEAARVDAGDDKVVGMLLYRACADDRDRCSASGGEDVVRHEILVKGRSIVGQARMSAQRTLSTLEQLAAGLAPLPGRKTIVFLSDGFYSEDLVGQLQAVVGKAALANVRIYGIDTRGLNRGSADSKILDAPPQQRVILSPDLPGGLPDFDIGIDGPNSLAVDTGGFLIRNENDLPRAMRDIANDTSSYYVIGYRPAVSRDGKFHSIRVTLRRPGLTVRARKGYLASADGASPTAIPPTTPPPSPPPAVDVTPPNAPATLDLSAPVSPAAARIDVPTVAAALGPRLGADTDGVRRRPVDRPPVDDAVRLRNGTSAVPNTTPMSDSLMARARDGWAAYQRGDTKTALTILTAPAESSAAPPWINYVLGWAAFAEAQWVVARNAWNVVRAAVPDFAPIYFDIADAYLRQGKAAEALVVLRAAEKRWPASLEILNAVGVVQTSIGQWDEAVGQFEKALAASPNDSSTRFNLGGAKELRYVRSVRQLAPAEADRRDAITEYRRVAEASGPFSEPAKAGLRRLIALDVRALRYTAPVVLGTLTQNVLHGRPVRLAWSQDGQHIYVMGMGSKTEGHVLASVPGGAVTQVPSAPEWTSKYWLWKAGQRAPWLPSLVIKSDTKRMTAFNSTDPGNTRRAYAPPGGQMISNVLLFHGEVIAEASSGYVLPGLTFSWSPFAMGAVAFVTPRNRLAIMDSEGHKIEVAGTHDVVLPAWSEDGNQIAYLVPAGNNWVLQLISLSLRD